MSGIDIVLDGYIHRELACSECGNALVWDGDETHNGKKTITIRPCGTCVENSRREGYQDGFADCKLEYVVEREE